VSADGKAGETLVVRRFIPVPRQQVFAAWLDPASLAAWMRPGGTTDVTVEVDPRVGGKFRIVMAEGAEQYEHIGEYLVIEPPHRLSFTWISQATDHRPTTVTVELFEREGGTELVLTHRQLPSSELEPHRRGWTDIVRELERKLSV
jgi:uncharacterized protein YndB with AHSA1/START domain